MRRYLDRDKPTRGSNEVKDLNEVLPDVFGARFEEFSEDLQERLRQVYREGVKQGLYLERERLPVPPDVFETWEREEIPLNPEDTRRTPGRLGELESAKKTLLELVDTLGLEIEHCLRPECTLGLGGDALAKKRHQFFTITQALCRTVNRSLDTVKAHR